MMNRMDEPFIKRLIQIPTASISLSEEQQHAVQQFRVAVDQGIIKFQPNPCICGAYDDLLLASRDRYGLSVRTVICRECGLLRTDPYMDGESVVAFYNTFYRSIYVPDTLKGERLFQSEVNRGRRIVEFVAKSNVKMKRVFEVGCGSGGILYSFLSSQNSHVVGCDLGSDYLKIGKQRGLDLRQGGIEVLKNEDPADLIILSHVIEHFVNPLDQLKQLHHLLTPGGVVYVEVPGVFWLTESYDQNIAKYLQNAHVYHFTLQSLDYVMALSGFRRVVGTEQIMALYVSDKQVEARIDQALFKKTISYIKNVEILHKLKFYKYLIYIKRKFKKKLYPAVCLWRSFRNTNSGS